MDLLIIRHARAKDRDQFAATGQPDSERPLTAKGIRRMIKAARGLRLLLPSIDVLVSSPLQRAVETAQVLSDAYGGMPFIQSGELAPDVGVGRVIDWLASQRPQSVLCIIGHEPDLGELLKSLILDPSKVPATLKKGSATLVRFTGPVASGRGVLQWDYTAKALASPL